SLTFDYVIENLAVGDLVYFILDTEETDFYLNDNIVVLYSLIDNRVPMIAVNNYYNSLQFAKGAL
ncbi:MAG: hypothetical protein LBH18_02270, partial [Spirochaetaceae bacterium]|nr:hypothetical protein [Spirochaetaceae bacterium]